MREKAIIVISVTIIILISYMIFDHDIRKIPTIVWTDYGNTQQTVMMSISSCIALDDIIEKHKYLFNGFMKPKCNNND